MKLEERISGSQLFFLIIGCLFSSASIIDPASPARQDAWLAYIVGWGAGLMLFVGYVVLAKLNPGKTLMEILCVQLGKYVGTLVGLMYIWYFIHLASLVVRKFGGYMLSANYPETPLVFIVACLALVAAYAVRYGIEVVARASELVVPLLLILIFALFLILIPMYKMEHLLPVLEHGWGPILTTGFAVTTFPFGEGVVFLMIFPFLHRRSPLMRTTLLGVFVIGLALFLVTLRDLLVLGPDMFERILFPPEIATKLIEGYDVDPFVSVNLVIGGGIQFSVCLFTAVYGLAQLLKLNDFKPLVLPVIGIVVPMAIWVFDNIVFMVPWFHEIWPYYSLPFQVLIPLLLIGISFVRKRMTQE